MGRLVKRWYFWALTFFLLGATFALLISLGLEEEPFHSPIRVGMTRAAVEETLGKKGVSELIEGGATRELVHFATDRGVLSVDFDGSDRVAQIDFHPYDQRTAWQSFQSRLRSLAIKAGLCK